MNTMRRKCWDNYVAIYEYNGVYLIEFSKGVVFFPAYNITCYFSEKYNIHILLFTINMDVAENMVSVKIFYSILLNINVNFNMRRRRKNARLKKPSRSISENELRSSER